MWRILSLEALIVQNFSHYCLEPFLPLLGNLVANFEVKLETGVQSLSLWLKDKQGCLLQLS